MRKVVNKVGGMCDVLDDFVLLERPDITVRMSSYNHEKYIGHALESVLSQNTKYSYLIVISDDASTDRTADIIREYKSKYPNKILALLHEKNQGTARNGLFLDEYMNGKYIATLDGDDFWTNELKLEKQVTFLEEHPDYAGTAHLCNVCDENERIIATNDGLSCFAGDVHFKDVLDNTICYQSSTLVRKNYSFEENDLTRAIRLAHPYANDQFRQLRICDLGAVRVFNEYWSTYRALVKKGGTNATSWANEHPLKSTFLLLEQSLLIEKYFHGRRNTERRVVQYATALLYRIIREKKDIDDRNQAIRSLRELPFRIKIKMVGYPFFWLHKKLVVKRKTITAHNSTVRMQGNFLI